MTSKRRQMLFNTIAAALVLGSIIINIKNIFTSCHVDAEYQVTMAYRIVRGDRMFSQMWEAHQTSAFFLAFFEWIFLKITGSTTGIMVYANAVGVFCKTAVAFCVYGSLRKYVDKWAALAALLFALNTYPKEITVLPDFANMQIWFGLLLICCLICYFEQQQKRWLVLGAICLCIQALAYPSCVLVWIACVALIGMYSHHKVRDISIFTGICGFGAIAYLTYFMCGDPQQFLTHIYYIWSGDEAHAVGLLDRIILLGQELPMLVSDMKYVLIVAVCAVLAAWACMIVTKNRVESWTGRKKLYTIYCWFLAFYILGYLAHLPMEDILTKHHFYILYIFVEIAAWAGKKYLNATEERIFMIGQLIGFAEFVATLLLSDLGVFTAFPYLIPAISVSMLPISKLYGKEKPDESIWKSYIPVMLLCAVLIFRNLIYLNGWLSLPANIYESSIFGVTWTVSDGPLKGIANLDGAWAVDVSYQEWQELVHDGDRVLILGHPTINPTIYLNRDVEICADSTISTPTYSERLLTYWEENPDKYPNVVILKCYDNTPMMGEYNRITQWLEEEFPAQRVVDGMFWRYFFLE